VTEEQRDVPTGPNRAAIGCLLAVPGFFGGGMVGAFVSKLVSSATACQPPEGLPGCNLAWFVWPGALIGVVLLPSMVLWRLRRGNVGSGNSARS
jgi:hypothetical protein